MAMVERESPARFRDIRVVGFNSLIMDFAEAQGASTVIRVSGSLTSNMIALTG